jgi:hypothetical protein
MTGADLRDVGAVVLAGGDESRLARALASVAWAGERVVLDPARRIGAAVLPPGVRRVTGWVEAVATSTRGWCLLLVEDEEAPPDLATAVATAVGAPAAPRAYRVRQEVRHGATVLRLPGAPIRLARREAAVLRLRGGLGVELRGAGGAVGRLPSWLRVHRAPRLAEAVAHLEADGASLAAVLHQSGAAPRALPPVVAGAAAAARILAARYAPGSRARSWGRWTLAVFAGYRPMVAYAKLWELCHREAGAAS